MSIHLERSIATKPETCWRCKTLGLPEGGIAKGQEFMLVTNGMLQDAACMDCMERLMEELEAKGDAQ